MSWIFNLFKRKKNASVNKKAVVFVDYEHWYISLEKNFKIKPNIKSFIENVSQRCNIKEIIFFGDFSSPGMRNEMQKIRAFTNKIVETKNGSSYYKKDYTDFIILDHIYQSAYYSSDVDTFIIFTGDGHFSSVALFLKNGCKKEVGIYGVKNSFSNQLKQTASWYFEVPFEDEELQPYCNAVLTNIKLIENEKRKLYPTYGKTIEAVSVKYGIDKELIKKSLDYMIKNKYIRFSEQRVGKTRSVRILVTDWKKIEKDKFWYEGKTIIFP